MAKNKKRNFLGRLNWSRPRIEAENQLDWIIDQQKKDEDSNRSGGLGNGGPGVTEELFRDKINDKVLIGPGASP